MRADGYGYLISMKYGDVGVRRWRTRARRLTANRKGVAFGRLRLNGDNDLTSRDCLRVDRVVAELRNSLASAGGRSAQALNLGSAITAGGRGAVGENQPSEKHKQLRSGHINAQRYCVQWACYLFGQCALELLSN
jgi:hypothetical protein